VSVYLPAVYRAIVTKHSRAQVCDLLEAKNPPGIMHVLDDVCTLACDRVIVIAIANVGKSVHAMEEGADKAFMQVRAIACFVLVSKFEHASPSPPVAGGHVRRRQSPALLAAR
jgi:hypothetical protein